MDQLNARESERMNWCLADVASIHGEMPWAKRHGPWNKKKTPLIFPDENPTAARQLSRLPPGRLSIASIRSIASQRRTEC